MLDEADCELVQVGLEMLMSDPLVRPAQPRVAVPEHTMPLRQRRLGLFRVPLGARTVAHRPRGAALGQPSVTTMRPGTTFTVTKLVRDGPVRKQSRVSPRPRPRASC